MTVKELKEFTFEKYYRQIGFAKENNLFDKTCLFNKDSTKNARKPKHY